MDHRYGRHGPRAWLRWYKRHRAYRSLDLASVEQEAVIYVHFHVNVERIIFIVTNPLPPPRPPMNDDAFVFLAQRPASRRAKDDILKDTVATNEEIDQLAHDAWEQIEDEKIINLKGDRTFEELERLCHDTYVETYLRVLAQENAQPSNRILRTIRRMAYEDRAQDEDISLGAYLQLQATIRVYPLVQCSPLEKPTYLEEVARLIQIYLDYYHEYPGRNDRLNRSNTFP